MKSHFEARFAGVGGQGVITAGKILAYAIVSFEGGKAVQTPTYTAQVRGGAAKVDVVVDENHVEYPKTENIDFFLSPSSVNEMIAPGSAVTLKIGTPVEIGTATTFKF